MKVDNELLQKLKNIIAQIGDLNELLESEKLFEKLVEQLIKNNKLSNKNLKLMLSKIDNLNELFAVCRDDLLIKRILENFILDKELVDSWTFKLVIDGKSTISNIFDLIKVLNTYDKDILKLNELNKVIYRFNKKQKLEIIEILRNDEIAQNRFDELINYHLLDKYDFDFLMSCLKKQEKKNLFNV